MTVSPIDPKTALLAPADAVARLVERLAPVATERVSLSSAAGRVLAETIVTDRPSPPCDVSSMDGYAVRISDIYPGRLPVAFEVAIGSEPEALPRGVVARIFTGGAVPANAEAVIKREDVRELPDSIEISAINVRTGMNIRRRGENAAQGSVIATAGVQITPSVVGALATLGGSTPLVYRRVRVSVIVTGNELVNVDAKPGPAQIRDSNGPQLHALLATVPWIDVIRVDRALDQQAAMRDALQAALETSDAVVFTGGVSMGDYDYVPGTISAAGGAIVFHKVAQRPGKPMLGAVGPRGQLILGLPGNPVSALVTMRRWGSVGLRMLAGFATIDPPAPTIELTHPSSESLNLWWHRPVRLTSQGKGELVKSMGSGDVVSIAQSDGFIELPPHATGAGPWPFYPWSL